MKPRKAVEESLKPVFYWQNQQLESPHSFIGLLSVGDRWVFLLKFPAQSRTATNTTSDLPGFHWCTLVSWFDGPLCK